MSTWSHNSMEYCQNITQRIKYKVAFWDYKENTIICQTVGLHKYRTPGQNNALESQVLWPQKCKLKFFFQLKE